MKNPKIYINIIMVCFWVISITSCQYEEVVSVNYPNQKVYFSLGEEIYLIDEVPEPIEGHSTGGNPYRFTVDRSANKFHIPLSVCRSGIDNKGVVQVNIAVDTDTIQSIIAKELLEYEIELLPSGSYSVASSVEIPEGAYSGVFSLEVDLDFLRANAPDKKYALALTISSSDREATVGLTTLIVVIDTKIMIPVGEFSFLVDLNEWNRLSFRNLSSYTVSYSWDFGDGGTSTEKAPSHVYAQAGIYDVTMKAVGLCGDEVSYTLNIPVLQLVKISNELWSIHSFSTDEPEEGGVDSPTGYISAVIDGDLSTFWHSQWSGYEAPYPHWFVVDMGKEWTISSFVCYRRPGDNRGQTECKFYTSLDGTTWEDQGTYDVNTESDEGQTFTMSSYPRARYFKYEATKGNSWFAFLAEIEAYGAE